MSASGPVNVDAQAWAHLNCLEEGGFPALLWDTLKDLGYTVYPEYSSRELMTTGQLLRWEVSVRNVVPTLTVVSVVVCPSMVGAKELETRGLSWFRPGPYVQQWCARGTILLCTGVPVVGRLQARRERRRDLQVPGGVIEASANIVGGLRSVSVVCRPLRRGGSPSFYRPRRG
jgi:hypothetical protein